MKTAGVCETILDAKISIVNLTFFQASLEVVVPPEIQGMGEFKAGPGDVARLAIKVRAFPEAELEWFRIVGEGEEAKQEKIDPKDKKFAK